MTMTCPSKVLKSESAMLWVHTQRQVSGSCCFCEHRYYETTFEHGVLGSRSASPVVPDLPGLAVVRVVADIFQILHSHSAVAKTVCKGTANLGKKSECLKLDSSNAR